MLLLIAYYWSQLCMLAYFVCLCVYFWVSPQGRLFYWSSSSFCVTVCPSVSRTRLLSVGFRRWSRFCSQPAGGVSHKPGRTLPLLFATPAVTLATLKGAASAVAASLLLGIICRWLISNLLWWMHGKEEWSVIAGINTRKSRWNEWEKWQKSHELIIRLTDQLGLHAQRPSFVYRTIQIVQRMARVFVHLWQLILVNFAAIKWMMKAGRWPFYGLGRVDWLINFRILQHFKLL